MNDKPEPNPLPKLAIDVGPLALFFLVWWRFDIFIGTAVFVVAVIVALIASYVLTKRWPIMLVVSAIVVVVFGGLTIALHDKTFIMVKPTIIYALFGAVLLGGYVFDKPMLAIVFDSMLHLTAEGWRKLTLRWASFFFTLAALNEVIRNTQSEAAWFAFKISCIPLTFIFAAAQYPLIMRYAVEPATERSDDPAEKALTTPETDLVGNRD